MATRSYDKLMRRLESISAVSEARLERIGSFVSGERSYDMVIIELGSAGPRTRSVMIAAGIHGDEPAGVEAALTFIENVAKDRTLLQAYHFVIFPCNNPTGYELGTRENEDGIDLNRQFSVRKPSPEVALIAGALAGRCFDLVFEMHEDIDSPGLYLYEIADSHDRYIGEEIISAAAAIGCPINLDDCIEGMPASGGIIRRSINLKRFRKTRLPQAIYVYRTCGGHVITLEPPASRLSIGKRVEVELLALEIALRSLLDTGP